jgi:predicted transcriptional regulator
MGENAHRDAVLLAIYPRFADAILDRNKEVEFRKRPFGRRGQVVFLYATKPVKAVVGFVQIDEVFIDTVPILWKRFGRGGGITKEEFFGYFSQELLGCATRLCNPCRFRGPIPLGAICSSASPPQSFRYLSYGQKLLLQGFAYE